MEKLPELMGHIKEGRTIIMNRYIESQYAYGVVEGHDFKWLHELNKYLPKSDIVFLLDLDMDEVKQRVLRRNKFNGVKDSYENNFKFLEKVKNEYLKLYLDFDNWHYVNCTDRSIESISDEIITKLFFVLKMVNHEHINI